MSVDNEPKTENNGLYKRLLGASIDAIVSVAGSGEVILWNAAAESLFGYAEHEMLGKPIFTIIPAEMRDKHKAGFARFLNTEKPVLIGKTVEVDALRKDGGVFPVELSLFADKGDTGWAFTAIIRDITLRKKAEDSIMRRSEELAKVNTELCALFAVSSSLSHPLELEDLLTHALRVITKLDTLDTEKRGGIFIIEGDRLVLAAHLGHNEGFLKMHGDVRVGQCLCGLAARSGEAVWSANSDKDARHTIRHEGMSPHGHLILPLKHEGVVLGVMYLFLPVNTEISGRTKDLLTSLAGQLGGAIHNARLYKKTKEESLKDPLTGLANRRLMDAEMARNLTAAKKFKTSFSVLMADIDYFKKYNDTYGHAAGDKLLEGFARLLMALKRGADTVVRYGGEEFLMLMPGTSLAGAIKMSERLRERTEKDIGITVSIGVAAYHEGVEEGVELIKEADSALYRAKQSGRNRVEAGGVAAA
ncbi:MAG: diguanylate cyclase [Deltaproteobacteria bacterium]|nr:diguanylate cyclase [Deltaproteobacteria bacterium]